MLHLLDVVNTVQPATHLRSHRTLFFGTGLSENVQTSHPKIEITALQKVKCDCQSQTLAEEPMCTPPVWQRSVLRRCLSDRLIGWSSFISKDTLHIFAYHVDYGGHAVQPMINWLINTGLSMSMSISGSKINTSEPVTLNLANMLINTEHIHKHTCFCKDSLTVWLSNT